MVKYGYQLNKVETQRIAMNKIYQLTKSPETFFAFVGIKLAPEILSLPLQSLSAKSSSIERNTNPQKLRISLELSV